jgi:multidrug efflux pump
MRSNFFLQRPVLAWVLALGVMLAGALGLRSLPLAQYPDIAPPAVMITAQYPGASAEVVEKSVTQVLEQALKGVEHLLYFSATSNASGQAELMLTFAQGTDVDTALVQVQNLASQALQRLPAAVQRNGLQVRKLQNSFLMIVAVYDRHDRMEATAIADWMATTLEDPISRIDGVGAVQAFDAPHAMRIWLDPHKLRSVGLVPGDVVEAIETQNADLSVGELGGRPAPVGQPFHVTVAAGARLQTPEQFGAIVIKTQANGATVHLSQVARIELGSESYGSVSRLNGHPASALAVRLAPGANALRTAQAIQAQVRQLQPSFPAGLTLVYPEDSTRFVTLSITEVGKTLLEALVLVVLVMYGFLGSWRATWIPVVTVPVVLLGTCAVLALLGQSLNTLTLFGMVLAIGLLVDDTIVVVENVERLMHAHGWDARTATAHAMGDISGALVGIGLVLGCIFLPMAFFPGSVGVIYRQFSITLVVAMALSVAVALCLTPVLCAAWLRPMPQRPTAGWAQRGRDRYAAWLGQVLARPVRMGVLYGALVLFGLWAYPQLPTAFLPEEDHGTVMVRFGLPAGATAERTLAVTRAVERYFLEEEAASTEAIYVNTGMSFDGAGQNAGMAFVSLKPWAQRHAPEQRAQAIADRAMARLADLPDAEVYAMVPPAVEGLGQSNGFELWLQDRGGLGHAGLARVADTLVNQARAAPQFGMVRAQGGALLPQLRLDIDEAKAATLGLDLGDLHTTLETAWGGRYVNDFVLNDRLRKVVVQADAPYRAEPDNLRDWHVRGRDGGMTSLAAVASSHWRSGLGELQRYNGLPALPVFGMAAPGVSSGDAMAAMEALLAPVPGVSGGWGGLSFEERRASGQVGWLYAVSLLFIFLCLAALYESWSVPCAVLLVVPLGGIGALAAAGLRGLPNDIYFQVGLLTAMGLSAKNAVLIVEFAQAQLHQGVAWHTAAVQAAGLRLRPILMTSLAFGAGVLPLAVAWGPHAASQNAIGTSVLGGVLTGTLLALVFVPLAHGIVVRVAQRVQQEANHGA